MGETPKEPNANFRLSTGARSIRRALETAMMVRNGASRTMLGIGGCAIAPAHVVETPTEPHANFLLSTGARSIRRALETTMMVRNGASRTMLGIGGCAIAAEQ